MMPVLIFDIDGTLLDTLRLNMVTLLELVHELGFNNEDGQSILRYASHPGMQVMHEFGIENPEEAYARWVQKVRAFPDQANPYPGVIEMIKILHERGYRLGIVSSKRRQQYEIEFNRLALIDYFDGAVLADDCDKQKPDPEPLIRCCELLGVDVKDAVYLGDSILDRLAAEACGMPFIACVWKGFVEEGLEASKQIDAPQGILNIFK
jgi:HAD superfamily hydrolase (TIGR01549 family)